MRFGTAPLRLRTHVERLRPTATTLPYLHQPAWVSYSPDLRRLRAFRKCRNVNAHCALWGPKAAERQRGRAIVLPPRPAQLLEAHGDRLHARVEACRVDAPKDVAVLQRRQSALKPGKRRAELSSARQAIAYLMRTIADAYMIDAAMHIALLLRRQCALHPTACCIVQLPERLMRILRADRTSRNWSTCPKDGV